MGPIFVLKDILDGGRESDVALASPVGAHQPDASTEISYLQLKQLCQSLENQLENLGCSQGCAIAIVAPHSLEIAISLLALPAAGYPILPLNPALASDSAVHALADAGIKLLLVSGGEVLSA